MAWRTRVCAPGPVLLHRQEAWNHNCGGDASTGHGQKERISIFFFFDVISNPLLIIIWNSFVCRMVPRAPLLTILCISGDCSRLRVSRRNINLYLHAGGRDRLGSRWARASTTCFRNCGSNDVNDILEHLANKFEARTAKGGHTEASAALPEFCPRARLLGHCG